MKTRLTQKGYPFKVDDLSSDYISQLHKKLAIAKQLAEAVEQINSNYTTVGAGYLANMKELAKQLCD